MAKHWKKVLALTLATGLFVACDSNGEEGQETDGATEDSGSGEDIIELTYWHAMGGSGTEAVEEIAEEFNQTIGEEQGIVVDVVYQGDYNDLITNFRAATQANDNEHLPDLLQVSQFDASFVKDFDVIHYIDELVEQDEEFSIEDLEPNVVSAYTYQDELLGLPFAASTPLLFYNAEMLEEAGFDSAPETIEELGEVAAALTEDGVYGFNGTPGQYLLSSWMGQMDSYIGNHRSGREGTITELEMVNDGSLEVFLNEWKNAYDMGGIQSGYDIDAREEFAAERIGMYITSTAGLSSTIEAVDDNFEMSVAYLPRVNEEANVGSAVGGNSIFLTDRYEDEERVQAGWEFMKFAASPEVQLEWHQTTGYFPVNVGTHELDEMDAHLEENPLFSIAIDQLHDSSPEILEPFSGVGWEIDSIIEEEILAFVLDEQNLEETIERIDEEARTLYEEYNRSNP